MKKAARCGAAWKSVSVHLSVEDNASLGGNTGHQQGQKPDRHPAHQRLQECPLHDFDGTREIAQRADIVGRILIGKSDFDQGFACATACGPAR